MAFTLAVVSKDSVEMAGGVVHLAARGEAAAGHMPAAGFGNFEALLGPDWVSRKLMMNMEDVPYLASAAIGWLITVQKQLRTEGGMLVMYGVQPAVRNVLNLLKVERVVPVAKDAAEARMLLTEKAKEKKRAGQAA